MPADVTIKQMRREAPGWIFDWSGWRRHALGQWLAFMVVGGLFSFLVFALRVQVSPPVAWAAPEASWIHVGNSEVGKLLAQRAKAEGPFPSRFSPSTWEGVEPLEKKLVAAMRGEAEHYGLALRPFPGVEEEQVSLAARGEPVLPSHRLELVQGPVLAKVIMVPELFLISGIRTDELPHELPIFEGEIDESLSSRVWQFLLQLDGAGRVRDCISMAGGDGAGPVAVENWLRQVVFASQPDAVERWVALSVRFKNQVVNNGADTD